jgi:multiple RNA-binding domain-containing protein 1
MRYCVRACRRAFRGLAYTKVERVPLYLEWAPVDVFSTPPPSAGGGAKVKVKAGAPATEADGGSDGGDGNHSGDETVVHEARTVYVKNLNFSSTEEGLRLMFAHIAPVRCGACRCCRACTCTRAG